MIKDFHSFLNESSSWYPTFKAQGEVIDRKDDVNIDELEKIGLYFSRIFTMDDVKVGKIQRTPDGTYHESQTVESYGVIGKRYTTASRNPEVFTYYWREGTSSLEQGWIGRLDMEGRSPRQFMSPLQFLECVEMHYLYSYAWIEQTSIEHKKLFSREMNALLSGRRKTKYVTGQYGL
jgi:hypothetical protein